MHDMPQRRFTRREIAKLLATVAATAALPRAIFADQDTAMMTRGIPSSDEKLPVIGLGTYSVFDVDAGGESALEPVLSEFVKLGGRVVDSSPMYGRAEQVVGDLSAKLKLRDSLFLATKVWTRGKEAGVESMERSLARMQTKRMDLMQVHNLLDLQTHLATLRAWKEEGRVRYIGITHYNSSAYLELERLLQKERFDFIQINYSLGEREAEQRILPLARDRGVAVLINRPFGGGDLFQRLRGAPLPAFAREVDCTSWARLMLKWIVAHPAVTCVIPATNKLDHLRDNMRAGSGRLPDPPLRKQMAEKVATC
jgi:aryl-alcohol dehydrogenase-like predicted oxidoreductase